MNVAEAKKTEEKQVEEKAETKSTAKRTTKAKTKNQVFTDIAGKRTWDSEKKKVVMIK